MNHKPTIMTLLCLSLAGLTACGSDDEGSDTQPTAPCNERGGECPAGQVCWPNAAQNAFECLNAAAGVGEGSSCVNIVGSPTCDEGLACVMLQGQTSGSCMKYCDPKIAGKGCEAGESCTQLVMPGVGSAFVCVGSGSAPDAGTDSGGEPDAGDEPDADAGGESEAG